MLGCSERWTTMVPPVRKQVFRSLAVSMRPSNFRCTDVANKRVPLEHDTACR